MDKQKQMTQPERAFWRDAFLAAASALIPLSSSSSVIKEVVQDAADLADAAVQEYRTRILWRDRK